MLVYKYRGEDDKVFQRDLNSIEKNYFWSSSITQLNDPWETLIESKKFISQSKLISRLFGKGTSENVENLHKALENFLSLKRRIGIYSLSKTFLDELLWAHYANSHQGFCVEYDLEILLDNFKSNEVFSFAVKYNKVPPAITVADVSLKNNKLIYKLSGFKSKRWEYEQEHRLITDYSGKQSYNHNALKSIYFGLRMSEENKLEMFERLKGRGINFFQIQHIEKSYKFEVIKLQNPFGEEYEYLKTIPSIITNGKASRLKLKRKNSITLRRKV